MNRTTSQRGAPALMLALLLTGCAGSEVSTTSTARPTDSTAGTGTTSSGPTVATGPDLVGLCPDPIVIQTDWFPEAEHGAVYQMVGDGYQVDVDNQVVSGDLVAGTTDLGVDIEVRTGGPAIGGQPVSTQMYTEPEIHLGYVSTDEAAAFADDAPTVAVVAPLEKNPQIIMWDPATYPDVRTIADLGAAGVTVTVFPGGTFPDVLVSTGILSADQIDPSYNGSPSAFVAADGALAQQGFVTTEPYNYEFVIDEWMKPVAYQLIHEAGFQVYPQAVAVRPDDIETLAPCLERLVPTIQQAAVDYVTNPERVNAMIVDIVAQYDDFWVYDDSVAAFAVDTQIELGLVGNGPDSTLGNMDPGRIQAVIDQMLDADMDVLGGLTADDISTNRFIDAGIGLD